MRVVFWTDLYLPYIGGVEVLCSEIMTALVARGHAVMLITNSIPDVAEDREENGVHIRAFPFRTALHDNDLAAMKRLCSEVRDVIDAFEPDVVHAHLCGPATFYQIYSGAVTMYPTIVTVHGSHYEAGLFGALTGRLMASARVVTGVSNYIAQDVTTVLPAIAGKVRVVRNAVIPPARPATMASFTPPELLCAGRISREKGFDVAIRALALLPAPFDNARLTILGNGPSREQLQDLTVHAGVADRVHFVDGVPPAQVYDYIDACSVVLMLSRWQEAFGLVALQAWHRARVVIASDSGALAEIQPPGADIVPIEDAAATADAIVRALSNPAHCAALASSGMKHARTSFDFDAMLDAYEGVYAEARSGFTRPLSAQPKE